MFSCWEHEAILGAEVYLSLPKILSALSVYVPPDTEASLLWISWISSEYSAFSDCLLKHCLVFSFSRNHSRDTVSEVICFSLCV